MLGNKISQPAIHSVLEQRKLNQATENTVSAEDLKKLGADNIGDALNKISDPNWVDPKKVRKSVGNSELDKDAFMKLMLAQLKNQDPTNPLKSHETAAQLAQFSSLEQLYNLNDNFEKMSQAQEPTTKFQILSLMGKKISTDSSTIHHSFNDSSHDVRFNLGADATYLRVKVRDAEGNIVKELDIKEGKKGVNTVSWNGRDKDGVKMRAGEYDVIIEAKNNAGKKIPAATRVEGVISGVNYTNEGPVLMVGKQSIKLSEVKKIEDPGVQQEKAAAEKSTETQSSQKPDLKKADKAVNNEVKMSQEVPKPKGNISTIPMAQPLLDSVKENKNNA